MIKQVILCKMCGKKDFGSYIELAEHIIKNPISHAKSLKWAKQFKLRCILFEPAKKNQDKVPLTAQEKENKREAHDRELSGKEQLVTAFCPHCRNLHKYKLPVEYADSQYAWRVNGKLYAISCDSCRR